MRIVAVVTLFTVSAYSVIGFRASFEPGSDPNHIFKIVYAVGGLGCGLFASLIVTRRHSNS